MAQQSARFLMKLYKKAKQGKPIPPLYEYLTKIDETVALKSTANSENDFADPKMAGTTLRVIASHQINKTMKKIIASKDSQKTMTNATLALDIV